MDIRQVNELIDIAEIVEYYMDGKDKFNSTMLKKDPDWVISRMSDYLNKRIKELP